MVDLSALWISTGVHGGEQTSIFTPLFYPSLVKPVHKNSSPVVAAAALLEVLLTTAVGSFPLVF